MPNMDGTGPRGLGPMTGRGMGRCGGGRGYGFGYGTGRYRGSGLGLGYRRWTSVDEKAALDEEEKILKEELAQVQSEKKALQGKK